MRIKNIILFFCLLIFVCCFLITCRKDKGKLGNGYPEEISKIFVDKCASAGCHNSKSASAAAGINLETWDDMFKGGNGGACCIPYSHEYSTIFLYTNTDPVKGPMNEPVMPLNRPALSDAEMKTLTDWIDAGAPNSDGKIMWADNPNRKKFYVTNQGCDVVTVFDAATLLQMRYVPIGIINGGAAESPHMIKLSPDEKYWYVAFLGSSAFQKFQTSDDSHVADAIIGNGSWNTFAVSCDSKRAYVADWGASGTIVPVTLSTMTPLSSWFGISSMPHGTSISPGDTVYIACSTGNYISKVPVSDPTNQTDISIDQPAPVFAGTNNFEPHDIAWSPDSSMYFVACDSAKSVRVLRRSDDVQIASIQTGLYPVEMSLSNNPNTPYLFVTCMYDPPTAQYPYRGSISVINYNTLQWITDIKGVNIAEPHGIGVDDARGLVYVANRNLSGPLPHHSTSCSGRIGFMSFIDINTLTVLPKKIETAVDPYSVAVRH